METLPAPTSPACPVCRDPLDAQPFETCATCETPVHTACREYAGGCVRFACVEATTPRQRMLDAVASWATAQMLLWGAGACYSAGLMAVALIPALIGGYVSTFVWPILLAVGFLTVSLLGVGAMGHRRRSAQHGRVSRRELEALVAVARLGYPHAPIRRALIDRIPRPKVSLALAVVPPVVGIAGGVLLHLLNPHPNWALALGNTFGYVGTLYAIVAFVYRVRVVDELRRRVVVWHDELEAARAAASLTDETLLLDEAAAMKKAKG